MRLEAERLAAKAEIEVRAAIEKEAVRHTRNFAAGVVAQAKVDVSALLRDDDLVDLISLRSEEFNRLITNLAQDIHDRIERETLGSIFEGRSNANIAKSLQEIDGIGRTRARLIARDQASKLNGAMNQFRQEQAGITHYRWKTILDGRERPTHHANNDKVFAWDRPSPITGHPGHDINCRCRALAIVTDEPEDVENSVTPPEGNPDIGDFFAQNLVAIRSVASVPSTNVATLSAEEIAAKLAQTLNVQGNLAAVGKAFTVDHAQQLVVELYGFLPIEADIDALLGSRLQALFASRRTRLISAAKDRLQMIESTLRQAQVTVGREPPYVAKTPKAQQKRAPINKLPEDGLAGVDARQAADWVGKVSEIASGAPEEAAALENYTTGMFAQINGALRSQSPPEWLSPIIKKIDRALSAGTVPDGTTLYRGVRAVEGYEAAIDAFKVGGTFEEKSFLSTSTDLREAAMFGGDGGILLVIEAAGRGGLPVGKLSFFEYENEVLLQRNLKFRVVEAGTYTLKADKDAILRGSQKLTVFRLVAI